MKYIVNYKLFESAEAIINATVGAGTNEEDLVKAIANIQSAEDLEKIDDELSKNSSSEYKSVKDAVNGELGIFDKVYLTAIQTKLEQLGLPNYLKDGQILKTAKDSPKKDDSPANTNAASSAGESQKLSQGKISVNTNRSAPLIVVFGGIDVAGRTSGEYMYDYFKKDSFDKATVFVANSSRIDGSAAWDEISKLGLSPTKKILYLFSGGYLPGMSLLKKEPASNWDKIYLVDIWIGNNSNTANFYKDLAESNPEKVNYYYTGGENSAGGSNNLAAKNEIITAVNTSKNAPSHMGANTIAVSDLNQDIT